MEFPGFFTWAFLNSQLVTTILGALVLSLIVAGTAAKLSHEWEMRRKRFDFQLDTFRSFNDVCGDMLTKVSDLYLLRGTVDKSDFDIKDDETSYKVLAAGNNIDAQINAAFSDKSIRADHQKLRDILRLYREKTVQQTLKAPFAEIQPLIVNYLGWAEIIRVKMRKEMALVPSEEYEYLMGEAEKWTMVK